MSPAVRTPFATPASAASVTTSPGRPLDDCVAGAVERPHPRGADPRIDLHAGELGIGEREDAGEQVVEPLRRPLR